LPLLGVAAGATERIGILSSVLLTPFYHPLVLAKLATTLDIASGGRFTLGAGVGGEFPAEFAAAGLDVRGRGRRSNECLAILKRLWTEDRVTYDGQHFQLADASISPRPTQRPHPPIWIAGRRDAAMRRAARYGDGWLPYFYSPDRYRESVTRIAGLAHAENRDLSNFQWAFFPYISIYPTVEEAGRTAAEALGGRYRYQGDFVNIVQAYCLLGPPQECVRRLQEYIDAGARHIIFSVACPPEDRARHIETIAGEILPYFR
jgi:probable F420-dependent oxidoreductase